jgi:hypothetical protein
MKLRPPDSSFQDYKDRRAAFMKNLIAETPNNLPARLARMREWLEANSPFSPEEKLANLVRASRGEGIL